MNYDGDKMYIKSEYDWWMVFRGYFTVNFLVFSDKRKTFITEILDLEAFDVLQQMCLVKEKELFSEKLDWFTICCASKH